MENIAYYEDEFGVLSYKLITLKIDLNKIKGVHKDRFKDAFEKDKFKYIFYDNIAVIQYYGGDAEKYINDIISNFELENYINDRKLNLYENLL